MPIVVFANEDVDYVDKLNMLSQMTYASIVGTSPTTLTIGLGSRTLTTGTNLQFGPGSIIAVTDTADTNKYMMGSVTAYNPNTGVLTFNSTSFQGTGTLSAWSVTLAGSAGPAGADNTLSIGTVTQGASAAASITGTSPNQTLNLVIPQGIQGVKGVSPRGAWAAATPYVIDDLVYSGGTTWIRKVAGTTPTIPSSDATNWEVFAQKGADGAGTVAGITGLGAISTTGVTNPQISIRTANTSQSGEISSSDWNTFNGKQAALGFTPMSASETAAVSKTIHSGTIFATHIYDPAKDFEGGAWRKRCQQTTYYKEPINGVWLGQAATAAAAWAMSGAVTGAYFQNTTDGKFYALGASSPTVAETLRGNTREFPAKVAIIIHDTSGNNRVSIYDLTQAGTPMWMSFYPNSWGGSGTFFATAYAGTTANSVFMLNGQLFIGISSTGTASVGGLSYCNFIKDTFGKVSKNIFWCGSGVGIVNRSNYNPLWYSLDTNRGSDYPNVIVNEAVNAVTAVVLDGAPIDAATGLPVPTIALATDGGVSVIKHDGTVVSSAYTTTSSTVSFSKKGRLVVGRKTASTNQIHVIPEGYTSISASYDPASTPAILPAASNAYAGGIFLSDSIATMYPTGISIIKENQTSQAAGMVAHITKDYNSGWQVGDIRGAWLADTVAETITANTQIDSTFTGTGLLDGWTLSATAVNNNGVNQVDVTSGGSSDKLIEFTSSTVAGKTYTVTLTTVTYNNVYIYQVNALVPIGITGAAGTYSFNFVASANNVQIILGASGAAQRKIIDSISVKLAEPDRSVKNNGLVVGGTLTKTVVASGVQLVSYSGFSGANYLEQAYNSNLDFGTGEFHYMLWATLPTAGGAAGILVSRGDGTALGNLVLQVEGDNKVSLYVHNGTVDALIAQSASQTANVPLCIFIMRSATTAYIYINGVLAASGALSTTMTNTTGVLRVGLFRTGAVPHRGSIALLRAGATAPSADQIAHIYRTELALFQPNAKCTLDGTISTVASLAYDEDTDLLHAATPWGRSSFNNLVRVESEATTVGASVKVAASGGSILSYGTGAKVYLPSVNLRVGGSTSRAKLGLDHVENKSSATIRSELTSLNVTTALGFTPLANTYAPTWASITGTVPTFNQNTTGTAANVTGTVLGANGGTGINNSGKTITLGGNHVNSGAFASTFTFTGTTTVTFPATGTLATLAGAETLTNKALGAGCTVDGNAIGYRNIPPNPKSANYTVTKADAGEIIRHPAADTVARTFTIDSNANQNWEDGTAISIQNKHGAGVITISVTTNPMRLLGVGTTGSRTLAANGFATLVWDAVEQDWSITGVGVS